MGLRDDFRDEIEERKQDLMEEIHEDENFTTITIKDELWLRQDVGAAEQYLADIKKGNAKRLKDAEDNLREVKEQLDAFLADR